MNDHTGTVTVAELREALAHLDTDGPILVDIAGLPLMTEFGIREVEPASCCTGLRTLRLRIG